ncbi:MAG TPA: integrase core domain-containing protein [Dehalococcoidia bacterium]|nr:integrase core domain-containing protein [Dehalococcoidia bacterium]
MPTIVCLLAFLRALFRTRRQLVLENAALRQQLLVLRRRVLRRHLKPSERAFWVAMARLLPTWRKVLLVASPDSVLRWHKAGFRALWRWKCRHKIGRPEIPRKLYCLIRRLARENPTWGAHRIADELALLGWKVGKSTVGRYMHRGDPHIGQHWKTFIRNHMNVTAACDFFVVPTLGFRRLFAFVVLEHDRRRIRHIAVTARPSVAWTAAQVAAAYPASVTRPKYLVHDREKTFRCPGFLRQLAALGIEDKKTAAPRQPWMNTYCERIIGTLRRECTDHLIALNEAHLERLLWEYVAYYNASRTHMALERNAPLPRAPADGPADELVGTPVLGGLHHTYTRAA